MAKNTSSNDINKNIPFVYRVLGLPKKVEKISNGLIPRDKAGLIFTNPENYLKELYSENELNDIRNSLYEGFLPMGYSLDDIKRAFNVIHDKSKLGEKYDNYVKSNLQYPIGLFADRRFGIRDELLANYLNIPKDKRRYKYFNYLIDSKYKPTIGTPFNKILSFNRTANPYFDENLINSYNSAILNENVSIKNKDGEYKSSREFEKINKLNNSFIVKEVSGGLLPDWSPEGELGTFTISKGHDNKGDYISFYDDYDLNPFNKSESSKHNDYFGLKKILGNANDLSGGVGTPFTIYDRVYLDDYYKLPNNKRGTYYLPEVDIRPQFKLGGNKKLAKMGKEKIYTDKNGNKVTEQTIKNDFDNPAIRQAHLESSFDSLAVNKNSNATGVYQIRQGVVDDYNKANKSELTLNDMIHPKTAKQVYDWYMSKLMSASWQQNPKMTDDVKRARAYYAYNAGPTNVREHLNGLYAKGLNIHTSLKDIINNANPESAGYINYMMYGKGNTSHRNYEQFVKDYLANPDTVSQLKEYKCGGCRHIGNKKALLGTTALLIGAGVSALGNVIGSIFNSNAQKESERRAEQERRNQLAQQTIQQSNQDYYNMIDNQNKYQQQFSMTAKCGCKKKLAAGGKVNPAPFIEDGGYAQQISPSMFLLRGRSHKNGGIDINLGKDEIEAENGEVVKINPTNMQIFSKQPMFNGVSPAQLVMAGYNPNEIFKKQERFKDVNHLNDDGTKKARFGCKRKALNGTVIKNPSNIELETLMAKGLSYEDALNSWEISNGISDKYIPPMDVRLTKVNPINTNNSWLNRSGKLGLTNADLVSGGISLLGNILSTGISLAGLSKTKAPTAPLLFSNSKLYTDYNIAPQIAAIKREENLGRNNISRNTLSSVAALNRLNSLSADAKMNINNLYGTKENQEIALRNEDIKYQDAGRNANIQLMNDYNNCLNQYYNDKQIAKTNILSKGVGNIFNELNTNLLNAQTRYNDKQDRLLTLLTAPENTLLRAKALGISPSIFGLAHFKCGGRRKLAKR